MLYQLQPADFASATPVADGIAHVSLQMHVTATATQQATTLNATAVTELLVRPQPGLAMYFNLSECIVPASIGKTRQRASVIELAAL
jgi:hypothetical protein